MDFVPILLIIVTAQIPPIYVFVRDKSKLHQPT